MRNDFAGAIAAVTVVLCLAGCSREQERASTDDKTETATAVATSPSPAPPSADAIPAAPAPATELRIERLESVMVRRPADAPGAIVIRAAGSVSSPGWVGARLTPLEDESAGQNVRVFSFVATSPETSEGIQEPQPVQTELRIDNVPAEVRAIRVLSATNAISAPIVQ